ncbi:MAG: AbgT family transporter [Prevotella sp.]|nr:AbgT family transporter [Prevotella sp.]
MVYRLSLLFAIAQVVLILASWLLTAAMPDVPLKSLLSSGGIRWFFGNFARNLAAPELVYLIVTAIAWGSISASDWWTTTTRYFTSKRSELTSQQRFALKASAMLLLVEVVVMLCLTLMPHAVLLSITGEIFPSSFSVGLIPVIAFMGTTSSVFYGMLSGRFHSLYEVGQCMTSAGTWFMPLLLLYVLGAEFIHSFIYVFSV